MSAAEPDQLHPPLVLGPTLERVEYRYLAVVRATPHSRGTWLVEPSDHSRHLFADSPTWLARVEYTSLAAACAAAELVEPAMHAWYQARMANMDARQAVYHVAAQAAATRGDCRYRP